MSKVSYQRRYSDKNIAQANQPTSQRTQAVHQNPLQQLVNQSSQVKQMMSYQKMADRSLQSSNKPGAQPVVQRAAQYQVENLIGFPVSPAADAKKAIVEDLTAKTKGQAVGYEESAGTPWVKVKDEVKTAALKTGYSERAATKLVTKDPFTKDDIAKESTMHTQGEDKGTVTSFYGMVSHDVQPSNHQLYFHNKYLNGNWTMADNFRNPYLANFFANDLVEGQKEFARSKNVEPGGLDTITRANVVSKSGVKWAKENKITDGELSGEHLAGFLKTENGLHSMQMAKQNGRHIIGGEVSGITDSGVAPYHYFNVKLTTAAKFTRRRSSDIR